MTTQTELTFGQKAVGLTFNPSGDDEVHKAKALYATGIDMLDYLRGNTTDPEVKRMVSIAITDLQNAQMWHVKALTWGK